MELIWLPALLAIASWAVACAVQWTQFPALGVMGAINFLRCLAYLMGWWAWNPWGSWGSAVAMGWVVEEILRRGGFSWWGKIFCIGVGMMGGGIVYVVGDAASPLKSSIHVGILMVALVGLAVEVLTQTRTEYLARFGLMVGYVVGAIVSSRPAQADRWDTILETELIHLGVLSAFLWIAVRGLSERGPRPLQLGLHRRPLF